jgi:hypothetical protein
MLKHCFCSTGMINTLQPSAYKQACFEYFSLLANPEVSLELLISFSPGRQPLSTSLNFS